MSKFLFTNRWSARPVLGVVLTLLAVLAGLQYYWLGRLSEGEQAQLETQLQTAAARFGDDFMGTFSQARTLFQVPTGTGSLPAADLHRGYHQWQSLATTPALLEGVYWVRTGAAGSMILYRLDPQSGQLLETAWPEPLLHWKQTLMPPVSAGAKAVVWHALRLELDPHPTMLIPGTPPAEAFSAVDPGYVLLTFNPEILGQRHIPTLIARHFAQAEAYHLAVRKASHPAQMLYTSGSAPPAAAFDQPDIAVPLRPDTLNRRVMVSMVMDMEADSTVVRRMVSEATPWAVTTADTVLRSNGFGYSYTTTDTDIRIEQPEVGQMQVNTSRMEALVRHGPHGDAAEAWELVATHRAGSLQAAVRQARWRNLALSFGLLMILAGSAVLLVVTARRAQRLGAQQMEFVAGVSHELRTPLAVIHAAGENLADGVVAGPEQTRQYGQLIRDEGRRLSRMVEQTLALARIGSGQRSADLVPTAVDAVLEQALRTHQPLIEAAGIALEVDLAPDLPLVLAEAPALQSALENLIHNAVKYRGTGTRIVVRATRSDETVQVAVQDFGMGIAPEAVPHLFEPFYRAPAVVEAQMEGSGIGLSLVRHVMEAHHGRVTVESMPGTGSTFTLHLPVAPQPEAHP